jgi:hypothetical protein
MRYHPERHRRRTLQHAMVQSAEDGAAVVVLDIPLLFEKSLEGSVDAVLVVTAPVEVQRQRALEREGMTEEKLQGILQRQVGVQLLPYLVYMHEPPYLNWWTKSTAGATFVHVISLVQPNLPHLVSAG